MTVECLQPHGFCLGVRTAIDKATRALAVYGTLYCLHPLVHNEQVVAELAARGLRVVPSLDAVPDGGCVLFSAHGVTPQVRAAVAARGLAVVDATCPFVARAHRAVAGFAARGVPVVVIGHADHIEVQGFVGEAVACRAPLRVVASVADVAALPFAPSEPLGVVCQTTLAAETIDPIFAALRARFRALETVPASEACTATRRRQDAVKAFVAGGGDGVLVLGSRSSSNTRRLLECAQAAGARFAACVATCAEAAACDFSGVARLGLTSGASTPETLFRAVAEALALRDR